MITRADMLERFNVLKGKVYKITLTEPFYFTDESKESPTSLNVWVTVEPNKPFTALIYIDDVCRLSLNDDLL